MKSKLIICILGVFIIIFGVFLLYDKEEIKRIKVEIKGAILNPGVYEINENSRVEDLIKESGGLNDNADISIINLSKELKNEDVVVIYTKDEISEMIKGNNAIKYIEKECVCPILENAACFSEYTSNIDEDIINTSGLISINSATLEELLTLPGIGSSKAEAIIEYRNQIGRFTSLEQIKEVSGIGNSVYEKIKDYITL